MTFTVHALPWTKKGPGSGHLGCHLALNRGVSGRDFTQTPSLDSPQFSWRPTKGGVGIWRMKGSRLPALEGLEPAGSAGSILSNATLLQLPESVNLQTNKQTNSPCLDLRVAAAQAAPHVWSDLGGAGHGSCMSSGRNPVLPGGLTGGHPDLADMPHCACDSDHRSLVVEHLLFKPEGVGLSPTVSAGRKDILQTTKNRYFFTSAIRHIHQPSFRTSSNVSLEQQRCNQSLKVKLP